MKRVKNIFLTALLLLGGLLTTSCTDYQDEIDALDYRVTVLEELVKKINNNLEAMQVIVSAMEEGDYITNVRETEGGYVINFYKNGPLYIMDGIDGKDGKDAKAPDITIAQDPTDGQWYWVLNGEWLTVNGERMCAVGKDGKDGEDGKDGRDGEDGKDGKDGNDGKDAVSPLVRINSDSGIWEISLDGGVTWVSTGTSATGKDGKDGKDGQDATPFILRIYTEETVNGAFMVIETKMGTYKIPIYTN